MDEKFSFLDIKEILRDSFGTLMDETFLFVQAEGYYPMNFPGAVTRTYKDVTEAVGVDLSDDIPWVLKAVMILGGNELAFGYIKGYLFPEYGSINFMINSNRKLFFIDTQTGELFRPGKVGPLDIILI